MKSLFGKGATRTPTPSRSGSRRGQDADSVDRAGALVSPFNIYERPTCSTSARPGPHRHYNLEQGVHGDTPVPAEDRAEIRTEIQRRCSPKSRRDPASPRAGRPLARTRGRHHRVAGYDLTFSPVKRVSTLWASPRARRSDHRTGHHDAVADTLALLETQALFTREGTSGAPR